ncbi:MAG: hypothetical protein EOO52_16535 [Gammaproteobacteria bacterium]|nr:MAG: hypothetical protein EOO52_16535 [Gammaproteobacteria bacterium]
MKHIKLIIFALVVCVSFAGVAEAKSRGGSFKSGFASQKRNATKPAPTYNAPAQEQKKTAFGSFGAADAKNQQATANTPQSKMSKDLTGSAAQANALKTADARNKTGESTSESGWFRSGNQSATPNNIATGNATQTTPKTFERRSGQQNTSGQNNGLLHGLMWFMVGNSLAQHATAANSQQVNDAQVNTQGVHRENGQGSQETINGENNSISTEGVVAQRVQDVPAEETESIFMKALRFLLWIALIGGIVWVVRKAIGFRHRNEKKSVNYSLGS